jgi:hypothetical protein
MEKQNKLYYSKIWVHVAIKSPHYLHASLTIYFFTSLINNENNIGEIASLCIRPVCKEKGSGI